VEIKILNRSVFQRLLGIPATGKPEDEGCWTYSGGKIEVDLSRTPELSAKGGSIRLEGANLPGRILVIHGEDDAYHAFSNRCQHIGRRRLDPVPGTSTVQCCSVSKSTYDYRGNPLHGPARKPVKVFDVEVEDGKLIIRP
jgi:nitrite reductase/ring-hydroxylating ferredoxin subunit